MQDNDPNTAHVMLKSFMKRLESNWWRIPPESPDLNPIENLWHELKDYLRAVIKPTTKEELFDGILTVWEKADDRKCCKYIDHLKKVIPRVIEYNGDTTGLLAEMFPSLTVVLNIDIVLYCYKY